MSSTDVIVIGAGQQGLAAAKLLIERGKSIIVLEREVAVGERWRRHYDSLTLFTPRRYSALPGLMMPGEQDGFATKDEFADYLQSYAKHFNLPIVLNTQVTRLSKQGDLFTAVATEGAYTARVVIVAAGYTEPWMPACATKLPSSVLSIHSSAYRGPSQIPDGPVLVVGSGNSAGQIAVELAATHEVSVSLIEPPRSINPIILGKNFYWWREVLRINHIPADSWVGELLAQDKDFVIGFAFENALKDGTLIPRRGVKDVEGTEVVFEDGKRATYRSIIWATGYRQDLSWLDIREAFTADGMLAHRRGISAVPGLYFAGLRNQITTASSNIYGVGHTTRYVVDKVVKI